MTEDSEPHYHFIGALAFGIMFWFVVVLRGVSVTGMDTHHFRKADIVADTTSTWVAPVQ